MVRKSTTFTLILQTWVPFPEAFRRKEYRLIFIRIMYVDYFLTNQDSNLMITYVSNGTKHNHQHYYIGNISRQIHNCLVLIQLFIVDLGKVLVNLIRQTTKKSTYKIRPIKYGQFEHIIIYLFHVIFMTKTGL